MDIWHISYTRPVQIQQLKGARFMDDFELLTDHIFFLLIEITMLTAEKYLKDTTLHNSPLQLGPLLTV